MINRQKLAHLTSLINTSKILTDSEKSDWLSLLELMNDKQLGELEDILLNTKPLAGNEADSAQPQTKPSAPEKQELPAGAKLSHISNLPSGLSSTSGQAAQVAKPVDPGSENYNTPSNLRSAFIQSGQRMSGSPAVAAKPNDQVKPATTSELKANENFTTNSGSQVQAQNQIPATPKNVAEKFVPVQSNEVEKPNSSNLVAKPSINHTTQTTKTPVDKSSQLNSEAAREVAILSSPKADAQIKDIDDISDLTYLTVRSYYFESLLRNIQDLVMRLGYFAVIVALENSPAYKTYLNTGKMLLGDTTQNPQEMFTKFEFEQFTDLLLNMRININ